MKKFFSLLATAALAFGFTACEDVPAPYEINDGDGPVVPGVENTIFSTEFDGGATDGFTYSNVSLGSLSYVWTCDASYGYLKASAYAGGACHAAEAWAVSPAINLADCTKATLTFRHAINKIDNTDLMPDMMTVWVSTDYAGDASKASWAQLTVPTYPSGTSWTFVGSDDIDLADFCGKDKVYIGFKYISTDVNAGTWEVDAFKIVGDGTPMSGGGGTPDEPDQPDPVVPTPGGDNLISNGGFEAWASSSSPDGWKSTSTASNATLSQSTDAHGGTYSVKVGGDPNSNKRLASKEITLKAGTYAISFYAKAATTDGGSLRPGYAIVEDGKISGGNAYQYGDYINNLSSAWTAATHTFTLTEQTTVCLVVMNSKKPGADVLIDDFTLTTSDGGVVDGGGDVPDVPTPGGDIFAESFANGLGEFTIDNKLMPSALSYIWKGDTNYGYAKASAYFSGQSYDSESWLISPVIDLTKVSKATLSFSHTINKGDVSLMKTQCTLWAKATDAAEWEQVTIETYPAGTSWTFVDTDADLSKFAGRSMQFAFVYKSTSASSCSWEIKNLTVK